MGRAPLRAYSSPCLEPGFRSHDVWWFINPLEIVGSKSKDKKVNTLETEKWKTKNVEASNYLTEQTTLMLPANRPLVL